MKDILNYHGFQCPYCCAVFDTTQEAVECRDDCVKGE